MRPIAQRFREQTPWRLLTERASEKSWGHAIGLTVITAVAYFLAARTGLALLKPEGVAVIWPALGLAVGALIALRSDDRAAVATGICVGIVAARLRAGGNFWVAIALSLCNTGGGLLTARLIERWFGPAFKLENVSCVLGFLGATAVGTLAAAVSGTAVLAITEPTIAILSVWRGWFTSAALGIVTVAPLPIGLASAMRRAPPRREQVEGATALVILGATSAFVISLPPGPWETAVPVAIVLPIVLWIAVRCRPVFAAAAAFIVAVIVAWSTALGLGHFGDASVALPDRTLAAQTIVLAGALCLLILSALFAERREHEMILEDSNRRLQSVLAQREEAERTLSDRDRQLKLAGKAALVGSFAIDIDAGRGDFSSNRVHFSPGFAAIYGLPEETAEISVGDWRSLIHPDDLPRFLEHREQLFAERRGEHHAEFRIVRRCGSIRWIETRSSIEYDQTDHAKRFVGVNIDITERRRAEEALLLLALAGRAARVGNFAYDTNTEIMQISEDYAAIHGFPTGTAKITRSECLSTVHPGDLERVEFARSEAFRERRNEYSAEYRIIRPGGEIRWVEIRCFITYDDNGHPKRVVGVSIDVTDRKQAELRLAERNAQFGLAQKATRVQRGRAI